MKCWWPVLLLFLTPVVNGQILEDFEKGEIKYWTQQPGNRWEVSGLNPLQGYYSLHHMYDNPVSGHDHISIPLSGLSWESDTITWSFFIKHGYNPSSANNWAVFLGSDLAADEMYPQGSSVAIVVGVNFTGADDILKIWKTDHGEVTALATSGFNWQDSVGTSSCGIRVRRYKNSQWNISVNLNTDGITWKDLGNTYFPDTVPLNYFGIYYEYSSQQDRKLWFDNLIIGGLFIPDTIPPAVKLYRFPSPDRISISFTEAMQPDPYGNIPSFRLSPGNTIITGYSFVSPDSLILFFPDSILPDTEYRLTLSGLTDLAGNTLADSTIPIIFHPGQRFDIVINEIMADPTPALGLPDAEYIELFNRTAYRIWMDNWSITLGDKRTTLPVYFLDPGSYTILCNSRDENYFQPFGNTFPVPGMPALKNTEMPVTLRNATGEIIHHIRYSDHWYGDDTKTGGGWSLEQIDPQNPCPRPENWTASLKYPGGTPGKQNSTLTYNPDIIQPRLENIYLLNDTVLHLTFTEPYDTLNALARDHYQADHSVGPPVKVFLYAPDYLALDLIFRDPFSPGTTYTLTIENSFTDCSGNILQYPLSYSFSQTVPPDSFDIVINEVLFNPFPGGKDYVEIYNRSYRIFDISSLLLARRLEKTGLLTDICKLSTEPRILFPGAFFLLTSDPANIASLYATSNPGVFLRMTALPSMPDDKGNIVLTDTAGHLIDAMEYNEKMHFPLISDPEGVALERIRYDAPSSDENNWHSASTESGYGTPGLPNSQAGDEPSGITTVYVEPEIFSPDNDGYHDYLSIHYNFSGSGNLARIIVFNVRGAIVRTLRNNHLLNRKGVITWDGLDARGNKPPSGIYLIYFEVISPEGRIHRYKRTCVLARKR